MRDVEKAAAAIVIFFWSAPLIVLTWRVITFPADTTLGRGIAIVMLAFLIVLGVTVFHPDTQVAGIVRSIHRVAFLAALLSGISLLIATIAWTLFTLAYAERLAEPGLVVIWGAAAFFVCVAYIASAVVIERSAAGGGRLLHGSCVAAAVAALPAGFSLSSALWGLLTGFI